MGDEELGAARRFLMCWQPDQACTASRCLPASAVACATAGKAPGPHSLGAQEAAWHEACTSTELVAFAKQPVWTDTNPSPQPVAALRSPAPAAWADQLQLLLESTGEGIFGIDMDGRCTFINRAGAEMLGWRTEEVLGQNMHGLIHHSHSDGHDYPEADCPIFNAFRRGLPCRIDREVLWRADGSPFSAEYSSYPIMDGSAVQGAVVTFVDITERKRAEEQLREAHDLLEQRVQVRTAELSQVLGQLRNLSAYLETVREAERTRIARDVHDELGSLLVALKMDVNWLGKRLDDRAELHCKCQGMGRLIDTAVVNVGRIITDLRPSILDHQGLWAALEWQAQEFIETTELQHDLKVHVAAGVAPPGGAGADPRGERWAIAVFRIFQEMLSNVARHARARVIHIRLYVDAPPEPVLYIEVRDDGIGAERAALDSPKSYGVMGMRERAGHFGGQLRIDSRPGRGTCARLTMPLPTAGLQEVRP
jgi:PAS domain S-box-containing protein